MADIWGDWADVVVVEDVTPAMLAEREASKLAWAKMQTRRDERLGVWHQSKNGAHRKVRAPGERRQVTEAERDEWRALHRGGIGMIEIARGCGAAVSTVWRVIHGGGARTGMPKGWNRAEAIPQAGTRGRRRVEHGGV